ncbi:MAG: DUF4185 domain-containing protein, partial [Geodermatophilaceae bacterium]
LAVSGLLTGLGSPAVAAPAAATVRATGTDIAVPAPEWDVLFDRRSGWTGADGIYSIPLDGDERPGTGTADQTFFSFNDTFIGQVSSDGQRQPGSTLVNNTDALLSGDQPDPTQMAFYYRTSAQGKPRATVVPKTPAGQHQWFWPNDGIAQDGRIYLFSLREQTSNDPVFNFETAGVSLLSSPIGPVPPFRQYQQVDTPLYLPAGGSHGDTTFGSAVLPNTQTAGSPNPDGYLYVYGVRNDRNNKKLLVARVHPSDLTNFSAYEYYSRRGWSPDIRAAAAVTNRVSSEFSVSPLADGRYILVFQQTPSATRWPCGTPTHRWARGATTPWCTTRPSPP